jgi:hypothetical protein
LLRLLNPCERPVGEHVRLRRHIQARALEAESREFYPMVSASKYVPRISNGRAPEEQDTTAQLFVAWIAAVGMTLAIGFLASELLRLS